MLALRIIQLNRDLSRLLWSTLTSSELPAPTSPRVVFPVFRGGNARISEQEARVLCCTLLNATEFYYAVEAPTVQTYSQRGKSKLSARTDLALYTNSTTALKRVMNVEFKAKNPPQREFNKDIEKLIREDLSGNWFHLLDNENSGTLPSIARKFLNAFLANLQYVDHDIDIIFAVCIRKTKRAFTKRMQYQHRTADFEIFMQAFFADIEKWDSVPWHNQPVNSDLAQRGDSESSVSEDQ